MRKLTDKALERMIVLRERGCGYRAIAADLGVSEGAIHYQCLKHGVTSPRQTGRQIAGANRTFQGRDGRTFRPFRDDEDARIQQLSMEGLALNAIAREVGRPRTSVRIRLMTLAHHDEIAGRLAA